MKRLFIVPLCILMLGCAPRIVTTSFTSPSSSFYNELQLNRPVQFDNFGAWRGDLRFGTEMLDGTIWHEFTFNGQAGGIYRFVLYTSGCDVSIMVKYLIQPVVVHLDTDNDGMIQFDIHVDRLAMKYQINLFYAPKLLDVDTSYMLKVWRMR